MIVHLDLLNSINNNKVNAGLADCIVANSILSKDKRISLRTLIDYVPETTGILGMAVRKNDTSLLMELNNVINEMKAEGTLYAILIENGLDKNNIA